MGTKFTRRQFLTAVSSGVTYLALTNTVGCDLRERTSKAKTPKGRPLRAPKVSPLPNASSAPPKGVWAFRSRPDLSPPVLEVTTQAHNTAPGYIFVAPEGKGDAGQGGSMILDDSGQVVWFRPPQGTRRRAMDLKVQTYREKPVLTCVETPGEYVIFDGSYREIARFRAGNGYLGDHHEFLISPQDTALITIYNPVPWDLSPLGGPKDGRVWEGIVQELDIESGEVIWRLGGKKSDFEMGPGTRFAYQHDARRQPDGTLTIFDNGTTVFDNDIPKAIEESRAIVVELEEEEMRASLVREYTHPHKQYADAAGNMQVLANGNVFVGWGRALVISEFSSDGELLFDARLPPQNRSYRAFRFRWSAHPSDQPAAVAERASEDEVRVYASWNGATEVSTWEVLAGPRPGQLESVGSAPRDGFETAMLVQTTEPYVGVQAKSRSGRVLGASKPVKAGS